ncbi:class I SAM-dependent methyltransferase family protein [Candidatus Woesearchaeota archaeon]|nr:class I SAM-dependent methyltransferase family protein [Candidatus Woesearchaeota archaeon]HIH37878.1 class I SAM-dependent methyltransferase family protein [Candidatus Woesearchaeota archaeon]HIH48851.1 class I SAM-dependent methyltransferase family protein [Candidatus Woesearchaeota archaeon]HIJ04005.1 class I SAM-dependent methyltransferase family protein [Candidatus Woesearchaeota archaeon]
MDEMKPAPFKKLLEKILSSKEMNDARFSYDLVGSIAIIEVPDMLMKKEKKIGEALLSAHPQITTVVKKKGGHTGVYRTQQYRILAGKRTKKTTVRENGVVLSLHLEKTYYSVRFGTERLRIARLVVPGEDVLVMFSGIAPFPLVIAKQAHPASVYGIEINRAAFEMGVENLMLNKAKSIHLILGNVRQVMPLMDKKFDRIIMPLPKGGEGFLDLAIGAVKKDGAIHFYDFLHDDEFSLAGEKVKNACKTAGRRCTILGIVKCGQQSPRVYRICVDVKVF